MCVYSESTVGQLGEDLLTLWYQEEQYLLDFLFEGSLRRAFSLSVVKLVRFESPYWSQCPIRFRSDLRLPDSCKWSEVQNCMANSMSLELLVRKRWRKLMLEGVDFIDKSAWLERAKAFQASLGFPPDDWVAKAKAVAAV